MNGQKEILEYLLGFLTENRKKKFEEIIQLRTRYITVVLEDIYQSHNASAVLRSCDCFGIQDVHIIENNNKYEVNPDIALGSSKWLNLHRYNNKDNNTLETLQLLRNKGYNIAATTPHTNQVSISELDLNKPVALLFGTELDGLSKEALDMSDNFVFIPMYGFTESFNISVSAALCLYEITKRLRNSIIKWELSVNEKEEIMLDWARQTIKKPELLEKAFKEQRKS